MDNRLFRTILISVVFLLIGVIATTAFWTYTLRPMNNQDINRISAKTVLTLEEATQYLNLAEGDILKIIALEKKTLERQGVYYGERLPYFQVNKKYYFYKGSLDNWLEDATKAKRHYYLLLDEIKQE